MGNSKDGVRINVDASFQFVPQKSMVRSLTLMYKSFEDYEKVVNVQARSSIRHGCRNVTALEFQTQRSAVREKLETELITDVTKLHSDVFDVQLRNIDRPQAYEAAVSEKETARADIDLAKNQRKQENVKAQTEKEEASKLAFQTLDTARTEANVTVSFAENRAAAARDKFVEYARIYGDAKRTHGLTDAGILAYIGNGIFGPSTNSKVAVGAPSQLTY